MLAQKGVTRREVIGATVALAGLGCGWLSVRPCDALADGASTPGGIEPYESENWSSTVAPIKMAGDTYNGFEVSCDSYAIYNLKGNYEKLSFTLGHIDGTDTSISLRVFLDNELYQEYSFDKSDLPFDVQIPLAGVKVLEFYGSGFYSAQLGVANLTLWPNGAGNSTLVVPDGDYESEVMDNNEAVTVKVSVLDGLVSALGIESSSSAVSIEGLYKALGGIIDANATQLVGDGPVSQALFSRE